MKTEFSILTFGNVYFRSCVLESIFNLHILECILKIYILKCIFRFQNILRNIYFKIYWYISNYAFYNIFKNTF